MHACFVFLREALSLTSVSDMLETFPRDVDLPNRSVVTPIS